MKPFSETLFDRITEIYRRIVEHPFLTQLTDGTLSLEAFQFYVLQDSLYLKDFGRGLSLLAAKSPCDDAVVMFNDHAKTAIVVERSLHESFFKDWNIPPADVAATRMAQSTLLYTSYLLRVAYERPFHECLGAFLPCYWIYWEVGKELQKLGSPVGVYQRWIDTYASEEFATVVCQVIELMNRVAAALTDMEKDRVTEHFVMTSRFEYLFWDTGYRKQAWDI